ANLNPHETTRRARPPRLNSHNTVTVLVLKDHPVVELNVRLMGEEQTHITVRRLNRILINLVHRRPGGGPGHGARASSESSECAPISMTGTPLGGPLDSHILMPVET